MVLSKSMLFSLMPEVGEVGGAILLNMGANPLIGQYLIMSELGSVFQLQCIWSRV